MGEVSGDGENITGEIAADSSQKLKQGIAHTFRSLKERNFRLYFIGQAISLTGTWMQSLALSWLVYRVTKSTVALGVVEFSQTIPVLLLALAGGWVADHHDRRVILLLAQVIMLVQSALLAWLTLTNSVQLWQIVSLSIVTGIVTAFEMPARQSMIAQMVDKEHLVNAISLNSSLFNGSRVVGPAIAAVLVNWLGEGACFVCNSTSYIGSLVAFSLIKFAAAEHGEEKKRSSLKEGIHFAVTHPEVSRLLRLIAFISLFGVQFSVLLAPIAKDVLHQGVSGFGAIRVGAGIGALTAALVLAGHASRATLLETISAASLGFAFALAAFSVSTTFSLSLAVALLIGFCLTWQLSASHSLIQVSCPDHIRGRISSIWTMTIMGVSPLGSLAIGWLASIMGPQVALFTCSIIMLCASFMFILWRR